MVPIKEQNPEPEREEKIILLKEETKTFTEEAMMSANQENHIPREENLDLENQNQEEDVKFLYIYNINNEK